MSPLSASVLFIIANLLTVNAVTFCPFGFSPTNVTNGTVGRLSLSGLFLALNRPLQCNGTLAAWQYCYRATNGSAQITFQIWRPANNGTFSRQLSTPLSKTFSTAAGATVCERVVVSGSNSVQRSDVIGVVLPFNAANVTVGVFSTNGTLSPVRYIPANSTNSAQLNSTANVSQSQLSSSANASLMVYVELLETSSTASSSVAKTASSTSNPISTVSRSISPSLTTRGVSLVPNSFTVSKLTPYPTSSPTPYVVPRADNNAQVTVAAASASTVIVVLIVVCVVVVVVIVVVWTTRSRKSSTLRHPPTDNPTYDASDDPKSGKNYFDSSNLVKQISGKSLTSSSDLRSVTPRQQAQGRYLSLTLIPTSEVPEYEKELYVDPGDNIDEILHQLVDLNVALLTKEDITVQSLSRNGQFSAISKAVWKTGTNKYRVAVKSATVQNQMKEHLLLLQEAVIMGQFRHPNVMTIYGVVNEMHSAMLVIEYMHQGDLDTFLKTLRPEDCSNVPPPQSTSGLLLGFCQQIALAMHYLSSRGFVHCDLAARNVFVSEDNICKIGEFGMSKRLAVRKGQQHPASVDQVRWMAPETLNTNLYTSCSDTWSYGCLLYEIWTLGKMPYEDCNDAEVAEKISSGWRLPPPPGCPRHIYKIMVECWNPDAYSRPSFRDILASLSQEHGQMMTIPHEDARTHPKAATLGGNLQAGQGMYGDLQSSYTSGAYVDEAVYENITSASQNKKDNSTTLGREETEPSGVYEATDEPAAERLNGTEPGELYEGMNDMFSEEEDDNARRGAVPAAAGGLYDSLRGQEDPTYDVVDDRLEG